MQLYYADASPFARKVRVVIRELNMTTKVTEVEIALTPVAPNETLLAHNPFGKIPTLVPKDGPAIYDNRIICRYLCSLGKRDLYLGENNWELLIFEAMTDAIMDAAVSMAYEVRLRDKAQQSEAWIDAQWQKISRGLDEIGQKWASFLVGPANVGQIGLASALAYLDLRHEARNWRDGRPELADWFAEFSQKDSFSGTLTKPTT